MQLDLCLLEAYEHRREPDAAVRIELAIQYLRNHVGAPQMMSGLGEYLQISKSSLNRLFRRHTGKGPRAFAQDLRMEWAHEQLQNGKESVKAVAYALGYRHPPDFSRAFKHHFGLAASRIPRA
jgi:transcriptional regulator GlxA family with amidase domain